jgi:hypothetical protein
MAGWARDADALRAGCRDPCSATWRLATAGMTAARRGAGAGSGSGSASARAADVGHAAGADTAGGCSAGGPWWAGSVPRGECAVDAFISASSGGGFSSNDRFGGDVGVRGSCDRGRWVARVAICDVSVEEKARSRMTPHRPPLSQARADKAQRLLGQWNCSHSPTRVYFTWLYHFDP